jgi:16S rRNA processing protein RimM
VTVDLFQFGYISWAHGLDGEVSVHTFDPASTVLEEVEQVLARPRSGGERELTIEDVREGAKGELLVTFAGLRGRVAALALVGSGLFVRRADLEAPAEGEYFQGDLVGLTAVTPEGVRLGVVEALWSTGPVPNLVIKDGDLELLVPFAEDFVVSVELEAGRLVLNPPATEG